MPTNDPYAPGTVRQPRLQILNNGQAIGGALSFEIHSNAYYQADTFGCQFALNADPNFGLAFWGDPAWDNSNPLLVDIQASIDAGDTFTSLLVGKVDHIVAHLDKGLVEIDGRDLASVFIDAQATTVSYQNQRSSAIIESFAASHGMSADVTPTASLAGRYYGDVDHTITPSDFSRSRTQWNLMCSLAQRENYDLWVSGTTVHFHPQTSANAYVVVFDKTTPFSNAVELTVERAMSFSKDIAVRVASWNSKQAQAIIAYAPPGASGADRQFSYTIPNLSLSGAQAKANEILASLQRHERLLAFSRPADLTLSARTPLSLTGTGSSWDGTSFQIDSIERTMSWQDGFTMAVQAKTLTQATENAD